MLGAARCPNLAGREGVVVGAGRYRSTVRVMFDGFKSPTSLHSTYIEAVVEEGSSTIFGPADSCLGELRAR